MEQKDALRPTKTNDRQDIDDLIGKVLGFERIHVCKLCNYHVYKNAAEQRDFRYLASSCSYVFLNYCDKRDRCFECVDLDHVQTIDVKIRWWKNALEEARDVLNDKTITLRDIHDHVAEHVSLCKWESAIEGFCIPNIPMYAGQLYCKYPWDYRFPAKLI